MPTSSNFILDLLEIHQIYENIQKLDSFIDRNTITDLQSFNSINDDAFLEIQTILLSLEGQIKESSSYSSDNDKAIDAAFSSTNNGGNYISKIFSSIQTVLQFLSEIVQRNTERNQEEDILIALIALNDLVSSTLSKTDFNISEITQRSLDLGDDGSEVESQTVDTLMLATNTDVSAPAAQGRTVTSLEYPQVPPLPSLQKPTKPKRNKPGEPEKFISVPPPHPASYQSARNIIQPSSGNNALNTVISNSSGTRITLPANQASESNIYRDSSTSRSSVGSFAAGGASEGRRALNTSQQNSSSSSDMRHIMYMLRRMGDRQQCFTAATSLITKLSQMDISQTLLDLRDAEALKTLLTALGKSADWPEVELHISKAICMLVTHEDDSNLLLKNSPEILTALHMLQTKVLISRDKVTLSNTIHNSLSSQSQHMVTSTNFQYNDTNANSLQNSKTSVSSDLFPDLLYQSKAGTGATPLSPEKPLTVAETDTAISDMRFLISTTVATLVTVLCNEWRNNTDMQQLITSGTNNMNVGKNDINLCPGRSRAASGISSIYPSNHHHANESNMNNGAAHVNKLFTTTLESVVTIIMMICDPPAGFFDRKNSPYRKYGSSDPSPHSGSAAAAAAAYNSRRRSSSAVTVTPMNAPGSKVFFPPGYESNISSPYQDNNSFNLQHPYKNEDSHDQPPEPDIEVLNEYMDDASTILSASLCELAELPQCRPGLISGEALILLRKWIETSTDILNYYKHKLFIQKQSKRKRRASVTSEDDNNNNNEMTDTQFFQIYNLLLGRLSRLINNAVRTIMFILGGTVDLSGMLCSPAGVESSSNLFYREFQGSKDTSRSLTDPASGIVGYEYMVGRIDAQVVNENIPLVLVEFINTLTKGLFEEGEYEFEQSEDSLSDLPPEEKSNEDFDSDSNLLMLIERSDFHNLLPGVAAMNGARNRLMVGSALDNDSVNMSLKLSARSAKSEEEASSQMSLNMYVSECDSNLNSYKNSYLTSSGEYSQPSFKPAVIHNKSNAAPTAAGVLSNMTKPPLITHTTAPPSSSSSHSNKNKCTNNFEILRQLSKKVPDFQFKLLSRLKEVGLSKFTMIYLAQALYQLSSRMQNRHYLLSLQVPQIISLLLSEAIAEAEGGTKACSGEVITEDSFAATAASAASAGNPWEMSHVTSYHVPLTGASSASSLGASLGMPGPLSLAANDCDSLGHTTASATSLSASMMTSGITSFTPRSSRKNNATKASILPSVSEHHIPFDRSAMKASSDTKNYYEEFSSAMLKDMTSTWSCNDIHMITVTPTATPWNPQKFTYNSLFLSNVWNVNTTSASYHISTINSCLIDNASFLKSITVSCLGALSYFLSDTNPSTPTPAGTQLSALVPVTSPLGPGRVLNDKTSYNNDKTYLDNAALGLTNESLDNGSSGNEVIDDMCSEKAVRNLKVLLTSLPHSSARLAAIKVTSALSRWNLGLTALYRGGIFECLMAISKQLETTHLSKERTKREREREKEKLMIQNIEQENCGTFSVPSSNPFTAIMRNSRTRLLGGGGGGGGDASAGYRSARDGQPKLASRTKLDRMTSEGHNDNNSSSTAAGYTNTNISGLASFLRSSRPKNETVDTNTFKLLNPNNPKPRPYERNISNHTESPKTPPPPANEWTDRPKLRRASSNASEYSNFSQGSSSLFPNRYMPDPVKVPPKLIRDGSNNSGNSDSMSELYDNNHFSSFDRKYDKNNALLEETVVVCFTLANICQAKEIYAVRMMEIGLLVTMTNLCHISTNTINIANVNAMELRVQALRAISSMCFIISKVDLDELLKASKMKSKNKFFNTILNCLLSALKFPNAYIQKEAIVGIAGLALLDDNLRMAILGDPLQLIVRLILDRNNSDKEIRMASENLIKNIGFHDGLRDLELIGYDLEVLRDWYKLIQLLKPQEKAQNTLKKWIFDLFEGTDVYLHGLDADGENDDDYDHFGSFPAYGGTMSPTNTNHYGVDNESGSRIAYNNSVSFITTPDKHSSQLAIANSGLSSTSTTSTLNMSVGENKQLCDNKLSCRDLPNTNNSFIKVHRKSSEPIILPSKSGKSDTSTHSAAAATTATGLGQSTSSSTSAVLSTKPSIKELRTTIAGGTTAKSFYENVANKDSGNLSVVTNSRDGSAELNKSLYDMKSSGFRGHHSSGATGTGSGGASGGVGTSGYVSSDTSNPIGDSRDSSTSGQSRHPIRGLLRPSLSEKTYDKLSQPSLSRGITLGSAQTMSSSHTQSPLPSPSFGSFFKSLYSKKPARAERSVSEMSVNRNRNSIWSKMISSFNRSSNKAFSPRNPPAAGAETNSDQADGRSSNEGENLTFFDHASSEGNASPKLPHSNYDLNNEIRSLNIMNGDSTANGLHSASSTSTTDLSTATCIAPTTSSGGLMSILPGVLSSPFSPGLKISTPNCDAPPTVGVLDMLLNSPTTKYKGLDVPPSGVSQVLNIYYPSKQHQLHYMDLTALQSDRVLSSDVSRDKSINLDFTPMKDLLLALPTPYPVFAIYFPPSHYSFKRIARVIEKVIEEQNNIERANDSFAATAAIAGSYYRRWSLAFRDDSFAPEAMQDFHSSVMQLILKCSQIVSLSFTASHLNTPHSPNSSVKLPEPTAHLGHMAGNVPPNIRFLNFRGVLSSQSIQALSIILKRNNVAFIVETEDPLSPSGSAHNITSGSVTGISHSGHTLTAFSNNVTPRDSEVFGGNRMGNQGVVPSAGLVNALSSYPLTPTPLSRASAHGNNSESSTPSLSTPVDSPEHFANFDYHYRNPLKPPSGLLGLGITNTVFKPKDIEKIIELLSVYSSTKFPKVIKKMGGAAHSNNHSAASSGGNNMNEKTRNKQYYQHDKGGGEDSHMKGLYSSRPKGLRYLDLSANKLSDTTCAEILNAATMGPLEGLDLSTNNIKQGKDFLEMLAKVTPPVNVSYLRHLGLANNSLPIKTVCMILEHVQISQVLISLDLSSNNITSSTAFENQLESFLQYNNSLRILDLSYNKLSQSTVGKIYLGLEQNNKGSMLLVPLIGNNEVQKSSEFELIQRKLSDNRQKYKKSMHRYNDILRRYKDHLNDEINSTLSSTQVPGFADFIKSDSNVTGLNEADLIPLPQDSNKEYNDTTETINTARLDQHLFGQQVSRALELSGDNNSASNSPLRTPQDQNFGSNLSPVVATAVYSGFTSSLPLAQVVPTADTISPTTSTPVKNNNFKTENTSPSQNTSSTFGPPTAGVRSAEFASSVEISAKVSNRQYSNVSNPASETSEQDSDKDHRPSLSHSSSSANYDIPSFNVFFSAPLVWRDKAGKHHPLEILDYDVERNAITNILTEVHRDISISFQFATTDNLRTALSLGCRALHFSGHGHPQFLNFEDGRAGLQKIPVEVLRGLLRAGGLKLDFVFVSACHSRKIGEAFVEAGVAHVVCVKVDAMIQDAAANAFTRAFYLALFTGKTVQASFDIAIRALESAPYVPDSALEGEKFVLLPEQSNKHFRDSQSISGTGKFGNHDRYIFRCKPVEVWPSAGHIRMGSNRMNSVASFNTNYSVYFDGVCGSSGTFFGSFNSSLPPPPPDFEGREVDMYKIIVTLLNRRLVSLNGSSGVGKTAITTALCTYVSDRYMFADGVFYFRVSNITTYSVFLEKLIKGLFNGPPRVAELINQTRKAHPSFITATATLVNPNKLSASDEHHQQHQQSQVGFSQMRTDEVIYNREELIVTSLSSLGVLLVFDHADDLLQGEESRTDFKYFLSVLFDRCQAVKVLITSVESLDRHNITGLGVVEHKIHLGSLTLRSSIRLFARLAASLLTSVAKQNFISSLLPDNPAQHHVTYDAREISKESAHILELFCNGHPADVFKLACESTHESVDLLIMKGRRILKNLPLPVSSSDDDDDDARGVSPSRTQQQQQLLVNMPPNTIQSMLTPGVGRLSSRSLSVLNQSTPSTPANRETPTEADDSSLVFQQVFRNISTSSPSGTIATDLSF